MRNAHVAPRPRRDSAWQEGWRRLRRRFCAARSPVRAGD